MSGTAMLQALKSRIPERYKGPVIAAIRNKTDPSLEPFRAKKKVIIGLAGFYQNLGDMALTYSHKKFLEETLPGYETVLFPSHDTYRRMKALKSVCSPDDIVTTVGGGNMDDIYSSLENCRRFIVRSFPKNHIISFPQTFAFSDSENGRKALARSAKTYGRHMRLSIFAREPESAHRMHEAFSTNTTELVPDIVLSLKLDNPPINRDGVFVCIRRDKEAKLSPEQRSQIADSVTANHSNVTFGDTVDVPIEDCTPERYEGALERFWNMLRHQEVVVTDRLHGMIFCVITKTPCVVLANTNHKIEGVYRRWLADVEYITFLEQYNLDDLDQAIRELKSLELSNIPEVDFSAEFEPLRDVLLGAKSQK